MAARRNRDVVRSLAVARDHSYTAAQVEAALRDGAGTYTTEFRLLDVDLNHIADLTPNVIEAVVESNVDRTVKGSLTLDLVPHDMPAEAPDLATAWFAYYVQPWWLLRMPDGGWARFPMGVFVWRPPDRDIEGDTADGDSGDTWHVVLGDRCHDLDMSGPGPGGHKVTPDEKVTDAVKRVLRRAGITDTDGIVDSDELTNAWLTWSLVRDRKTVRAPRMPYGVRVASEDTHPETWLSIAEDLLDSIGYTSVWFDGDGKPRADPVAVLSRAAADVVYDTSEEGVVLRPQRTEHDPGRVANRVFCRAQRRNGDLLYGMADLDDVVPGHPLSKGVIDRYIDVVVDVDIAPSKSALEARARKKLLGRVSTYQTQELETLAWPVHEAFDVVGVSIAGDSEFGDLALLHERSWSMVLRSDGRKEGTMEHRLSRLVQVADP